MNQSKQTQTTLALFCKVVDNFGDIGICWRLARQLESEHGIRVSLWVDDLVSFKKICPSVDPYLEFQEVQNVTVRHWLDQAGTFTERDVADIVIEFFACDIPPDYIRAMASCEPRPVWLNLEGLTAEEWVEGCHTLPSPHPQFPLTKYFFFPGFTAKTGGLLCEAGLLAERQAFQSAPQAMADFLGDLGLTASELAGLKVSLFCYPHAAVAQLFTVWKNGATPITCLVPEGVAPEAVAAFLGGNATAGAAVQRGSLSLRVLPFVPQADYDRLLWACDLNFVRGEDSFVRAQWAHLPFIWHIYPQDENLHHKKLSAFLQKSSAMTNSARQFSLAWNGALGLESAQEWSAIWADLQADLTQIKANSGAWLAQITANGDLASNIVKFAENSVNLSKN
ncbi:MAG: elongation factor P maturation arginine rhamnosyltransferase EarP [Undibacterium sp.]|nr:elongation factor P maturation arginine rhamnosyltransferase EarP [Undibacterium sp.]